MNNNKKHIISKIIYLLTLIMIFPAMQAQDSLSLEKAVKLALKNNFDILIANNSSTISKVNNTAGNAGMLPTVAIVGTGNYSLNNRHQENTDGSTLNANGVSSGSVTAGAELTWRLFNGGKMFVTKNKLTEIQALGELQFRDKVLQTLFNVIGAYYDVVRQKQQLKSINEALNYNKERVKISQAGYNAGSLIKTDLLQAKIDMNVAMESFINQQFIIVQANKTLKQLLSIPKDADFLITDSIQLNYSPDRKELIQKLNASNTSILSFQKQIDIANLSVKEFKSGYLPTFDFNAGYYFTQSTNANSSVSQNRTVGPQVGGTLVIPLYSAGENKRKIAVARLESENAVLDLQNIKLQVNTILENTLTDFENQQRLFEIETENNELALENIKICLERLRLGQSTSLEVHIAQEDYVQSNTRLINFRYNLKLSETKLKQLVSGL